MKEKSDINKLLEGRCRGQGVEYVAFKKANESHSIGTARLLQSNRLSTLDRRCRMSMRWMADLLSIKNVEEDYQEDTISSDGAESAACANRFQHYKTIKRNLMMMNLR